MVEQLLTPITATAIALGTGAASGAFSGWLGWNASNEPFDGRKFSGAIATGVIAGMVLVFANLAALKDSVLDPSGWAFITMLGTIFMGTMGSDFLRNRVGDIVAKIFGSNKTETPVPATDTTTVKTTTVK